MRNFKFTDEVVAFIYGVENQDIILIDKNEKGFDLTKSSEKLGKNKIRVLLNNSGFKLKISGKDTFISNNSLPNKDKYYRLTNFNLSEFIELNISDLTITKGFISNEFSAVFSGKDVSFASKELNESFYNKCKDEEIKLLKYDFTKKTRSHIPGNRYESRDKSIVYLGKRYIKSKNKNTTLFHLYIDYSLIKKETTISEVMLNNSFGYSDMYSLKIIIRSSNPVSMIDCGPVLTDDTSNRNLGEEKINMCINNGEPFTKDSTLTYYRGLEDINTLLELIKDTDDDVVISEKSKNDLLKIIKSNAYCKLLDSYESVNYPINLDEDINIVSNNLLNRVLTKANITGPNVLLDIFNDIDLLGELSNVIYTFKANIPDMGSSIESLIDNKNYFLRRNNLPVYRSQVYQEGLDSDNTSLSSIITGLSLNSEIKSILSEAIDQLGTNVDSFSISQDIFTSKNVYEITISIHDIVSKYKGIDKIPENLKEDIINNKFIGITIYLSDIKTFN